MSEFVTVGFEGGTTFALTGENAGHWVEGQPNYAPIPTVTREDVMRVLAGSRFRDDAENPHSWQCVSNLYSCECASSLAADILDLFGLEA